jgi:hypothetical protein
MKYQVVAIFVLLAMVIAIVSHADNFLINALGAM